MEDEWFQIEDEWLQKEDECLQLEDEGLQILRWMAPNGKCKIVCLCWNEKRWKMDKFWLCVELTESFQLAEGRQDR